MFTKKPKLYVSIDIEKKGCSLGHPIRAVGIVVYRENYYDNNISLFENVESIYPLFGFHNGEPLKITKGPYYFFQFNIQCPEQKSVIDAYTEESTRCKTQFWDKHKNLWESFDKNAKPAEEQAIAIAELANEIYKYEEEYEIICVSDNPAFDFGQLDSFLFQHCPLIKLLPFRMSENGTYHCIQDPSERVKGLLPHEKTYVYDRKAAVSLYEKTWPDWRPHNPVYDAMQIMLMQVAIDEVLKMRKTNFLNHLLCQFVTICATLFQTVGRRGSIVHTPGFITLFATVLFTQVFSPFTVAATISATVSATWAIWAREQRVVATAPFCLFIIYYTLAIWVLSARNYLWETPWFKA